MFQRILFAIVLVGFMGTAHAKNVVLESYTGERPADAARLMAPILEELFKKDYETGDTIARAYETRVSSAAQRPGGMPPDFAQQVDARFKLWVDGQFSGALDRLGPLVELAHGNSGEFARNPNLRQALQKALIGRALAQQRIGDLGAMAETFKELLRSDSNAAISRATYGPEAAKAFEEVRRQMQTEGKGKLTIKLDDDAATVFIDEVYRGVGSMTVELSPGDYRVVAMSNKLPSRNHRVTVKAGGEAVVEIDPKLDQSIVTNGYTGLSFANRAERVRNQGKFAARFAKALGANAIALVGIDQVDGKNVVVGMLVSLETGEQIRSAMIPVSPDPTTQLLKSLAVFLTGGEAVPGLNVLPIGGAAEHVTDDGQIVTRPDGGSLRDTAPSGRWGGWRWLTGGVGLAGLATGAVLVGLDGRCSKEPPAGQQCNDLYATATPGYIALGAGAVIAGISVYLFATHESGHVATVTPTQGGAVASYMVRW
ncbi:MAG: hypothetical protein HOV81_20570 [Kofleriaceae bacterium]|nr:hypothetical protein [Kofleriaceae bacterium]